VPGASIKMAMATVMRSAVTQHCNNACVGGGDDGNDARWGAGENAKSSGMDLMSEFSDGYL